MNTNNVPLLSNQLPTLRDRAMLINLKLSMWEGYAYDRNATLDGFGSTELGRASKCLLKNSSVFKATKSAFASVRTYLNDNTLPWKQDGTRLLPSANYLDFANGLRIVKTTAEAQLTKLDAAFANEVYQDQLRFEDTAVRSGGASLFNPNDYPVNISSKFKISCSFEPIPSSTDFRVDISDDDKASLDKAVTDAQAAVTTHILEEMAYPMKLLAEHLSKPVGDVKRYYNSIVTNVSDTATRLKRLNVNDDPVVNALIKEVHDSLSRYTSSPEILKVDQTERDNARVLLKTMLSNMGVS